MADTLDGLDGMDSAISVLTAATNKDVLAGETKKELEVFWPGRSLEVAPQKLVEEVKFKSERRQKVRAEECLYMAETEVRRFEPAIRAAIDQAAEPPDAEGAYLQRTRQSGLSANERLQLIIANELIGQRISQRELPPTAPPSVVLDRYSRAVANATPDIEDAIVIRQVEQRHGRGWGGPPNPNEDEGLAVLELAKTIEATRAKRVPAHLWQAEDRVKAARSALELLKVIRPDLSPRRV